MMLTLFIICVLFTVVANVSVLYLLVLLFVRMWSTDYYGVKK